MHMQQIRSNLLRVMFVTALVFLLFGIAPQGASAQGPFGAVYVLTNQSSGNSVMVYRRAPDGTLSLGHTFLTGGTGVGTGADPLASQGSLVLGRGQRLLFAVNAGSNDVSLFAVTGQRLHLLNKVASGGQMPVSIAVHGRLVYVLNAGGTPNIKGFVIDFATNRLVSLPGSLRNLPGGAAAAPAEVSFSPNGAVLMVTEKGTNKIDTYTVNNHGYAGHPMTTDSSGATPFGFAFVREFAVVSEAGPSALSSYEVENDGELELITGSLGDTQAANCWVVATDSGRYAYTSNTGSGSISSYTISRNGMLSLLDPTAGMPGGAPIDMALTTGSRFLYARDGANNVLDGFRVARDGSLTPVGTTGGVPSGAQGIAAR
ncbi:MAG: lactonase family protein [Terriglobia bacterium]